MRSNYGYNPMGSQGVGGQYGTQQGNLGRYRPPTMNGSGGWNDSGGYAYNLPNAYGSTGLGYMSGLGNMFNPWQGNMNPQMNYGGGSSFQQMLQQLYQRMPVGQQQQQPGMGEGGLYFPGGSSYNQDRPYSHDFGNQSPTQNMDIRGSLGWNPYDPNSPRYIGPPPGPQTPGIGRDNRMNPGGGANIGRGRYPQNPRAAGGAPNPQMVPGSAPSVGGTGGGGISRPGGGMSGGIAAPSPVGGVTNAPPQQPRLWWGGNGGG